MAVVKTKSQGAKRLGEYNDGHSLRTDLLSAWHAWIAMSRNVFAIWYYYPRGVSLVPL